MLKPALIGGVLLGVLSALPLIQSLNCFCCAWVIAGGVLAANFYVKASPLAVSLGSGALLGLLTGAIGAVVDTIFSIPVGILLSSFGMNAADSIREVFEQVPNMPPETKDTLLKLLASGPGVGIVFLIFWGFFKLIIYSIVAALGGALGVAIFEKRKPGTEAFVTPPAYQPPPHDLPPPPPPPSDMTGN
jgi:hypothetical protein